EPTPAIFLALVALGILEHAALGLFRHAIGHTHGQTAFFGITENKGQDTGVQGNVENKQGFFAPIEEMDRPLFIHYFFPVESAPFVVRTISGMISRNLPRRSAHHADNTSLPCSFRPEINARHAFDLMFE